MIGLLSLFPLSSVAWGIETRSGDQKISGRELDRKNRQEMVENLRSRGIVESFEAVGTTSGQGARARLRTRKQL
jgi:hypothetical protein